MQTRGDFGDALKTVRGRDEWNGDLTSVDAIAHHMELDKLAFRHIRFRETGRPR
jgi:hypothetical protein